MRCLPTDSSGSTQGFFEKWIRTNFNVFSPENVHVSSLGREEHVKSTAGLALSGAFGFIRLSNLSPPEVAFLARASSLEQCLFALLSSRVSPPSELHGPITMGSQGVQNSPDEGLHSGRGSLFLEVSGEEDEDLRKKAVQRLLMLPSRSESGFLRAKHPAGPLWQPFEALAVSPEERFLGSVGLLRSVRSFMPPVRAPQVTLHFPSILLIILTNFAP
jgi:DNA helicase INO80